MRRGGSDNRAELRSSLCYKLQWLMLVTWAKLAMTHTVTVCAHEHRHININLTRLCTELLVNLSLFDSLVGGRNEIILLEGRYVRGLGWLRSHDFLGSFW